MRKKLVVFVTLSLVAGCDKFTAPTIPPPATGPAPDTTIAGGPRAQTRLRTATFQLSAVVAGGEESTFQCSLDQAPFAACTSGVAYQDLAPGRHTFRAYAVLRDGRFDASPVMHVWDVITTPVETTINSAPQPVTSSTSVLIAFASPEAAATFACSLDAAPFATCTSPVTLTGLTPGDHRFQVRAVDADGIADETPAEVHFRVDSEQPSVQFVQAPTGTINDPQFTFIFTANEEQARTLCRLDSQPFAPCQSPFTVTGLTPGAHQFHVVAEDAAGNRSTPATAGFMVLWRTGTACAAATDCVSNFCRDGVCCNEACDTQCRSCALTAGTCSVVRNSVDLDSCSGENQCDDNGTCAPRSTDPLFDGFEFSSPSFRFRGNFPAGRFQFESSQFRFEGRIEASR